MNDPPGVSSALGIEAVEWIAEGGENLTVRVTGRWRRRRPAWSGKPTLVVEAPGRRYRFPAMPEPPSLTGAGPGTWRISFAVPAALAPELGGRSWLQFGSVAVPLPAAIEPPGPFDEETLVSGEGSGTWSTVRERSAELRPPPAELAPGERAAEDEVRLQAEEADAAVTALTEVVRDLERDLTAARARAQELAASLSGEEGRRRTAQQREHAERALRLDLTRQLATRQRDSDLAREALGELAEAEARVRELETELSAAHRRIDEAEQAAAAALAARDRERRAAAAASARAPEEARRLGFERALRVRRAERVSRVAAEPTPRASAVSGSGASEAVPTAGEPPPAADEPPATAGEPPPADAGAEALVGALRRELDLRAGAEAGLRSQLIDAESRLAVRQQLVGRTRETLRELRGELDGLRVAVDRERAARLAAELRTAALELELARQRERTRSASQAIGELRGTLASQTRPADVPPRREGQVEPARLNEALARLRETVLAPEFAAPPAAPEPAVAPASVGKAWLEPIFRSIARSEPEQAGRLLAALLPAHEASVGRGVAYDLVLGGESGTLRVDVTADGPRIVNGNARSAHEVDFQVVGDHAALARMLVAGRFRRRFGRRVARVRGRREGVKWLEALIASHLDLAGLHRRGVRLAPATAIALVAALVDVTKTESQSFWLGYQVPGFEEAFLVISGGKRPKITTLPPDGQIGLRVVGPVGSLEQLLSGEPGEGATLIGDEWPLAVLRKWLERAQSG